MLLSALDLLRRRPSTLILFAITTSFLLFVWLFVLPSSFRLLDPAVVTPAVSDNLPSAISYPSVSHGFVSPDQGQKVVSIPPQQRAEAVKDAFRFAFDSYWSNCKGQDEISPVSGKCRNPRNHWGASAIDALSTAVIMEEKTIVGEILSFISTIDFGKTTSMVSLFETTIRYLAGMLSAYDLLNGPLARVDADKAAVGALLRQSTTLADKLKFAFNSPTGIPHNELYINQTWSKIVTNGLATTGSLILEWQRLSDLTGNPTYGDLAAKGESYLLDPKPRCNVPFPGLPGTRIHIDDGIFVDANGGWNGGDDSYYEYLIKMYVYDTTRYPHYRDAWIEAADSTIKHLASHPETRPDLTFLAAYRNQTLQPFFTHLGCFAGGNFVLAGQVLERTDFVDFGLQLVNGCHETYATTATRIGPESFSWHATDIAEDKKSFFDKHGFWLEKPGYVLRPEVIESYYYAYRITGDKKYQDWAWDAFLAINETCRTEKGFSSIENVNVVGGGKVKDAQESFLFAEVMKYSYLIQAKDGPWQVNYKGRNEFVYNTEAHPLKVAGPPK